MREVPPRRVPVSQIVRESWRETNWRTTTYLPVFPNTIPYNELLLLGYLRIGKFWVYTRSWELTDFESPFPMLLYNSKTVVRAVTQHYEDVFDPSRLPTGVIVGYAELAEVRPLNAEEIFLIFGRFNGMTEQNARRTIEKCFRDLDAGKPENSLPPYIWPCEVGLFFGKMLRFENPVRFAWRGRKHMSWAPLESVSAELEKVGVDPSRVSRLIRKTIPKL